MPFFTGRQTCQKLGLSLDATGGFLLGNKLSKTFLSMLKKQLEPYSRSVKPSTFKRKSITFKQFVSKVAKLILFDYSRQKLPHKTKTDHAKNSGYLYTYRLLLTDIKDHSFVSSYFFTSHTSILYSHSSGFVTVVLRQDDP